MDYQAAGDAREGSEPVYRNQDEIPPSGNVNEKFVFIFFRKSCKICILNEIIFRSRKF